MSGNPELFFDDDDDENYEQSEKLEELNLEDEIIIEDINDINDSDINNDTENFEELKIETIDSESEYDIYYKYDANNHRQEYKHSLTRDTILHGKKNEEGSELEENYITDIDMGEGGLEKGSEIEYESKHFQDYMTKKKLQEDVYELLKSKTNLDFQSNRRKPNKQTFNDYYAMLLKNLSDKYLNYEIFVELSYYFTDNIFNMYKLLDKTYATKIINELKDKGFLRGLDKINFK